MQAAFATEGRGLARRLLELSRDEAQRDGVVAANGHHVLIALLAAGPDSETTEHAARALIQISLKNKARKLRLLKAGIAEATVALLQMVLTANKQWAMLNAAALVFNFTLNDEGIEAFHEAGAIAPLVTLLSAAPLSAKSAAGALCNLTARSHSNKQAVNRAEMLEAGAIPPLVALLHGEAARNAAGALRNLANDAAGVAAIRSAGGIVPLVALLHAAEAKAAESAAGALNNISFRAQQSHPAPLAALAARPPPPPPHDNWPKLARLLEELRPTATERLATAEAGEGDAALQQAIDQAAAVGVADAELQRARTKLAAMREAAEAARRERRTSLGLDELKTPDEFVCPITYEVMQDPVCASDGHTYERSAIEEVLALPEERRRSPLTREPLQASLFPNRALKNRIAAHEQEAEALVEKAVQKAVEVERTSVASRKRPMPAGAVVIKLEDDSPDAGASSSSAAAGSKRMRPA